MMSQLPHVHAVLFPRQPHFLSVLVLFTLFGSGSGCSEGGPRLFKATGKITFNDKPLVNAGVVFSPADQSLSGILAVGRTDATGAFTLSTDTRSGTAEGNYSVTVYATEENQAVTKSSEDLLTRAPTREFKPPKLIPEKYTNPKESGLSFNVSATGRNHFEINLTGDAPQ